MSEINFGLLQNGQSGFQNALSNGLRAGAAFSGMMQQREEAQRRNALSTYAANPTREGLGALAQYQPEAAIQERGRFDQQDQQQQTQSREQLPVMIRLLDSATDEAGWDRAVQQAQQYGFDVSRVPQTFDPAWRDSTRQIANAMHTMPPQELTTVAQNVMAALPTANRSVDDPMFIAAMGRALSQATPVEPGGRVISRNPITGETTDLVLPGNGPGGASPEKAPGPSDIPQDAIEAFLRGEGTAAQFDEVFGLGASARVMGGAGSNAGGGFPGR